MAVPDLCSWEWSLECWKSGSISRRCHPLRKADAHESSGTREEPPCITKSDLLSINDLDPDHLFMWAEGECNLICHYHVEAFILSGM
jgi:hypothetical protein